MKRRRIILVLALAAVAAGIVLCWPRGPKEPRYQDKGISYWLNARFIGDSGVTEEDTRKALSAMGTNAVPYLMSEFTRPISKWRAAFNRWAPRNTPEKFYFTRDKERTHTAAYGLYRLGSNAASAYPTLNSYLADPFRCSDAAWAMSGGGELSLPYFLKAITSTNIFVVRVSIGGLANVARQTDSAIPPMIQLLNHSDNWVRHTALFCLSTVKSRSDLTVPAMIGAVSHPDPQTRTAAANILGRLDWEAKPAIPILLGLMTNSDPAIASAASNAVFRIDPAALPARP